MAFEFIRPGIYRDERGNYVSRIASVEMIGHLGDPEARYTHYDSATCQDRDSEPPSWDEAIREAYGRLRSLRHGGDGWDRAVITHGSGAVVRLDCDDKVRRTEDAIARLQADERATADAPMVPLFED